MSTNCPWIYRKHVTIHIFTQHSKLIKTKEPWERHQSNSFLLLRFHSSKQKMGFKWSKMDPMKPLEVILFAELKIVCRFTCREVRLMNMIQPYTEIQYCKCSRAWMFLSLHVIFNGKQTKGRHVQSKVCLWKSWFFFLDCWKEVHFFVKTAGRAKRVEE